MFEAPGRAVKQALRMSNASKGAMGTKGIGGVAAKLEMGLVIFEGCTRLVEFGRNFWRSHFAFGLQITEKDPLYAEVYDWLTDAMPDEKHKSIRVFSNRSRYDDDMSVTASEDDEPPKPKPLTVRHNENSTRKMTVTDALGNKYKVTVNLLMPDMSEKTMMSREPDYAKISFVTRSWAGQQAVLAKLEELNAQQKTTRKANLKMVNQWGSWRTRSDLPPRTMQSVILPSEQKERIVNDLKSFLESEDTYNRLAIPWHRGYMFHGPPGTGKTSLVKALANEFNLDLWYVSLSDLKAESSLLGLLSEVGPRSILLLEDIDTIKITHDRDASEQGTISMGSLLNTLDGVATPHGLVTVMTTNRFELLDPALTRAGRMDLIEMLDYPSVQSVSDMYGHFFGSAPKLGKLDIPSTEPIRGLSTSQVSEVMKRHMGDPKGASKAIRETLDTALANV